MEQKRIDYNRKYANWYKQMSKDMQQEKHLAYAETLKKKGERIKSCMNIWLWDIYRKNKLLDLQKVNRCMNNRFCPNCRKFNLSCAIHNLKKPLNDLLLDGYYPYLVTLTIPNVLGKELKRTIEKMNKAFKKLFGAYSYDLQGKTTKGFKDRLICFEGALKVLEITYNEESNTYHPHFHCLFFSQQYDQELFIKNTPGEFSNKRNSYNFYSLLDIQIMKLWTMYFKEIRVNEKNYNNTKLQDCFICDIREMDSAGIVEVLKYTFKDTDIKSYDVFKNIELAISNKRIRQGYGILYNLKLEDDADGEKLSLEEFLNESEVPSLLVVREIKELLTSYRDYKKISRSKVHEDIIKI
nr:protein rep [Clostridium acetobutylicum]